MNEGASASRAFHRHSHSASLGRSRDGRHRDRDQPVSTSSDCDGWKLPKKPGPKTVKAKLEGAQKVLATRKARGTMGKRQKRKIRG